ncbi:MAG: D-tyrosyl-tRNA(Tyr) deacylase [Deltaproteobacteria bacterium]|nr:D-tyrosyl-tRNA(Tyr) deacylase [Deltaproteobacteria bacterium]
MRALVQRVSEASVTVGGEVVGRVGRGLLVLVGVGEGDGEEAAAALARKVAHLRVFEDEGGRMNLSVLDVGGAVLAVSQFTLYGDCARGRRPSFASAARPERAEPLFARVVEGLRAEGVACETGRFRAHMEVRLLNDGPVTLWLEV